MSDDDFATGRDAVNAASGFEPMPRTIPKEEEEVKIYESDKDGLEDAARDLSKSRGDERPVIDRSYLTTYGPDEGEVRPANETVTAEEAASDLARQRAKEVAEIEAREDRSLADIVDEVHGRPTESAQEEALRQWQQQQQQANVEQPPADSNIDPELYQALKNPAVQRALQQQLDGAEKARADYQKATWEAAQLTAASLVAGTPELAGIPFENYPTAIAMLERTAPMKAAEIKQHIGRVQQLYTVAEQARADQARLEQQNQSARLQAYHQIESAKFDAWQARPENAQRVKSVLPHAAALLESEYGLGRAELQSLVKNHPIMSSSVAQQLIADALSFRQAQKTAMQNPARSVPPVQRPGVAGTYRASADADSAADAFRRNPTPRTAAAMLAAKRRAS